MGDHGSDAEYYADRLSREREEADAAESERRAAWRQYACAALPVILKSTTEEDPQQIGVLVAVLASVMCRLEEQFSDLDLLEASVEELEEKLAMQVRKTVRESEPS
jgi:hypothetical protein